LKVDVSGNVDAANGEWLRMFGVSAAETTGRDISAMIDLPGRGWDGWLRDVSAARTGKPVVLTARRSDGSTFPVELSVVEYDSLEGLRYVVCATDHSPLRDVDEMKHRLLNAVGHELRTPLTSLSVALSVATSGRLGPVSSELHRVIEIAERGTLRLAKAVTELLELAELSNGLARMRFGVEDVERIVGRALDAVSVEAREHDVDVLGYATSASLYADADQLVRALATLVSNAIRATPARGTVAIRVEEHAGWICCEIEDQGPPIGREEAEMFFEPFGLDGSANPRHSEGAGLSLAVARSIVEQHGGEISFESAEGGGLYRARIPSSVGWLDAVSTRTGVERGA
jgi:PAS domain S-box-containing protein